MAERLTLHKGYRGANGRAYNSTHNQREKFEKPRKSGAPVTPNVYYDFCGNPENTFSENEKRFYRKSFGGYIKRKNDKSIARRQYGRTETIEAYREKHPPEETLLYIGTKDVDSDTLLSIFNDFCDWQNSLWCRGKGGIRMLNAALHLDETTPHVHMRQVYMYSDKNGDWQVSQNKALELLGFERPDPTKPISRTNNAKMTYTAKCREMLFEIAKEHGVELETKPLPKEDVGLPLKEYIQREQAREAFAAEQQAARETITALEATKTALETNIAELEEDKADTAGELERLRKSAGREVKAREKLRKDAETEAERLKKQGYDDGFKAGAHDGEKSALRQLILKRQREADEENQDLEQFEL